MVSRCRAHLRRYRSGHGDRTASGNRQAGQYQGRHRTELSAAGIPRSRDQHADRFRRRAWRGARQEARHQDRLAANQFRPDDACDFDGEGGCDPVRHDGYGEPAGHGDLCRLPSQWAPIFRAAIARRRVQGHDGILREKGRRQPAHVLSEADRCLERCPLRRQPDSIRRHGRIGRCPDPAKAGTDRRGRPGRRDASLHDGPRAGHLCPGRRCVRRPVHRACFEHQGEGAPAGVRGGPGSA